MDDGCGEVTRLLGRLGGGDDRAIYDRLLPLIYDELRGLAGGYLDRERTGHTLQPTALVNEAFIRLAGQREAGWESKGHFMAIAATAMRRILVDHARGRGAGKRAGGWERVSLAQAIVPAAGQAFGREQLLALQRALEKLAELDPRQAKVVELRFFGGLTVEETARVLGVSRRTAEGDWTHARVWLRRETQGTAGS